MIRLFVSIALPDFVKQRLALLAGGVPGAKWIDHGNMHLTLRFIGEVPEDQLADIHHGLSRIPHQPFEVALAGVGTFSQGRHPTTLWVGLDRNDALQRSEEHTSELQSLMRISYAVFCLKKKNILTK